MHVQIYKTIRSVRWVTHRENCAFPRLKVVLHYRAGGGTHRHINGLSTPETR